jgi:hypothetical protein
MSYDVVLQRLRHGEAAAVESREVWTLLEQAWESPPDKFDYCLVRRGDDEGDLYAVQPGHPIDCLMFNHAGPAIYDLMYDVAVAGDMVIIPPDAGPFLVREEQREHLPSEMAAEAVVVRSGPELVRAIETA